MSVLTQLMNERADWDSRNMRDEVRRRQYRMMLESVLLVVLGFVAYCFHAQILDVAMHLVR